MRNDAGPPIVPVKYRHDTEGTFARPTGDSAQPSIPAPVEIPGCNFNDPAALEAWFGNYGWFEHYRKVVLSNCREMERAKAAAAGVKRTVDQIDDLARNHPNYLHLLTESLPGRILREKNVLESASR